LCAEAVTPNASRIPSAPTGSRKLTSIEGQTRPRVGPGRATVRYARQARRKGRTVVSLIWAPGARRRSGAAGPGRAREANLVIAGKVRAVGVAPDPGSACCSKHA
jgi:hypothetical protein